MPASIASRLSFSICTPSDGSAAVEVASSFMIDRAFTAGAPSVTLVEVGFTMVPPALAFIVLNHTVPPSYCAPWISM